MYTKEGQLTMLCPGDVGFYESSTKRIGFGRDRKPLFFSTLVPDDYMRILDFLVSEEAALQYFRVIAEISCLTLTCWVYDGANGTCTFVFTEKK